MSPTRRPRDYAVRALRDGTIIVEGEPIQRPWTAWPIVGVFTNTYAAATWIDRWQDRQATLLEADPGACHVDTHPRPIELRSV